MAEPGEFKQSVSVIAAALGCDDATLKAPLWWFKLPSQRCFHSGPLMEAYMTLHGRQEKEDFFFFLQWKWFVLHFRKQQEQTDQQTADAPRVERRLCCVSFTSRRLGVRFKGGEAAPPVSVSPSLSERVISLWNTTPQISFGSSHWLANDFIWIKSNIVFFFKLKKMRIDMLADDRQMRERKIDSFREAFVQLLLSLALWANSGQSQQMTWSRKELTWLIYDAGNSDFKWQICHSCPEREHSGKHQLLVGWQVNEVDSGIIIGGNFQPGLINLQ